MTGGSGFAADLWFASVLFWYLEGKRNVNEWHHKVAIQCSVRSIQCYPIWFIESITYYQCCCLAWCHLVGEGGGFSS